MNDRKLSNALHEMLSKEPPADRGPRHIARHVLRSEKWRFRLLAGLSVLFWLLAAGGLLFLLVGLNRFVIFVRISDWPVSADGEPSPERMADMLRGTSLLHHSIPLVAGSVVSLIFGAVCTLLLIYTSRRATLRQLNAGLLQISEQLRELRSGNMRAAEPRDHSG